MSTAVTSTLAKFITDTPYSAISSGAIQNAKVHILDTFGAAFAGYEHPVASIATEYCKYMEGPKESTIWGSGLKSTVPMAAFTNGVLSHAIDYDDWDAIAHVGHPSCTIVPAALSTGEAIAASGKALLRAYVLAIEVGTQISAACPSGIHGRGFHSTPIFGSLGSVVASACLRNLTADKIRTAFGVAASGAGGLSRQQGSMVKPFHAGNAARNGVEAVLLADMGFTADEAIIENPRGFCDSFFGDGTCDYDKMIEGVGKPFYLESPGLSFKLHPCGAPQFLAADATLHLVHEHKINAQEVSKLELRVNPVRYKRHYRPVVQSGLQGKFTINYVCAVAMLDGRLQRESFYDAKAKDPRVQEAFNKVEVIVDETIPEKGEYCPITIELKDGRRFQYTATIQKGHAKNPLTETEVVEKFRDNTKDKLSRERSDDIIACVCKLDDLNDVRELTSLLAN
jgi:2-methylcitrate dehydratase PrpD